MRTKDFFDPTSILLSLAMLAIAAAGAILGYALHRTPPDAMHGKVWIEFADAQHALDVAGRLGGQGRGLTVCLGDPAVKGRGTWLPPGTAVTGKREACAYKPREAPLAMLEVTKDNVVSSLVFMAGDAYGRRPP